MDEKIPYGGLRDFQRAIRDNLIPLLVHGHDVVLAPELPQPGLGKTKTLKELSRDYLANARRA